MSKTVNDLWSKVLDVDNIIHAIKVVSRGKDDSEEMCTFLQHLPSSVCMIRSLFEMEQYQELRYVHRFYVREPKLRRITAPTIVARVMHHCVMQVLMPVFVTGFSPRSYACIPSELSPSLRGDLRCQRFGRGTLAAVSNIQVDQNRALKRYGGICCEVSVDIKSFFDTVSHRVLKYLIRRKISDVCMLRFLDAVIDSYTYGAVLVESSRPGYFILDTDGTEPIGIPIGYLLSQLFGNIIGNALDHYVTDQLGFGWYTRYMDDIRVYTVNVEEGKKLLLQIQEFICLIGQTIHPVKSKYRVFTGSDYTNFGPFRVYPNRFELRDKTADRAYRRLRKFSRESDTDRLRVSYQSFKGLSKWAAPTEKSTRVHVLCAESLGN